MKKPALLLALGVALSACGGGSEASETLVAVQVVDFGGSYLGGLEVVAEPRALEAGVPTEITDPIRVTTDGEGIAYIPVEGVKDYRVEAALDLPREPGCSYVGSAWVSVVNSNVTLKLDRKSCR